MKKKRDWKGAFWWLLGAFLIFLLILVLHFGSIGGVWTDKELDFAQIDRENPFRAREYVESCGTLTATVTSFHVDPNWVWLEVPDSDCDKIEDIHITAWVSENTAKDLNLGETYTFRGKIYYDSGESDSIYIGIGDPGNVCWPFWVKAIVERD